MLRLIVRVTIPRPVARAFIAHSHMAPLRVGSDSATRIYVMDEMLMTNSIDESGDWPLKLDFDRHVKLDFLQTHV
jgi:hypothetical protein